MPNGSCWGPDDRWREPRLMSPPAATLGSVPSLSRADRPPPVTPVTRVTPAAPASSAAPAGTVTPADAMTPAGAITSPSPVSSTAAVALSLDDARRMTLRAQGFIGAPARRGGVPAMLRRVGAVQLDTISVLARSHELVAYARLGPVPRERIERAYWNPAHPSAFEYWAHAACVLPLEEWPYYAFRRRWFRARGMRWHEVSQ